MARYREPNAVALPEIPDLFAGPADIRRVLAAEFGEPWVISYLDRAAWMPSSRTIVPKGYIAYERMAAAAGHIAREMNFRIAPAPAKPPTVEAERSLAERMQRYKEAADRLRLEAIKELVRATGTRNVSLMNDRAAELWQRADNGEAEVAKLGASVAQAEQRRNQSQMTRERGAFEREADLMTLEEVMAEARSIATKRGMGA
jgi:hypothetical protein